MDELKLLVCLEMPATADSWFATLPLLELIGPAAVSCAEEILAGI